ncbi:MAG: DUF493 domain-containing protein [Lautropia sp.]|nr:DUF493 domain-containing protein [Lautropia sp.]
MHDNTASPKMPAGNPDVMQFPMEFPLKVMGRNDPGFLETVSEIIKRHAPDFDPARIEKRLSRDDTYLSMTATFSAQSREQLDALYRELSGHPKVSVVL